MDMASRIRTFHLPAPRARKRPALTSASALAALALLLSACATAPNSAGRGPVDIDISQKGPAAGTGIESRDIAAMTDEMMRDLLATPDVSRRDKAPRVVMDPTLFVNESSQTINKNLIVDRLRVGLNRAGKGRMVFVSREHAKAIDVERDRKRTGATDVGTAGMTEAQFGVDYQLAGRIASLDSRNNKSGMQQRYMQVTFEMLDLESGALVWSNQYEFAKAAADDVVYR